MKIRHLPGRSAWGGIIPLLCAGIFLFCDSATEPEIASKTLTISLQFKGPTAKGNFYAGSFLPKTDWALWVKNSRNEHIKTLKINIGVVKISKFGAHVAHLPNWLACAQDSIKDVPDADSLPSRFDAITSASPLFNASLSDTTVTATWDFTDNTGRKVPEGTYYFCTEVANIQKDSAQTAPGYTLSYFNETATGSVVYPAGNTTAGTPTSNIKMLSGTVK